MTCKDGFDLKHGRCYKISPDVEASKEEYEPEEEMTEPVTFICPVGFAYRDYKCNVFNIIILYSIKYTII